MVILPADPYSRDPRLTSFITQTCENSLIVAQSCDNGAMPKLVDHDDRRADVAEAVWRVASREGLQAATIRSVAAESGWSSGALRHYFPTKKALILFAIDQALADIQDRVDRLDFSLIDRLTIQKLLEELLPLDATRRREADAWLALTSQSRIDPSLQMRRGELDQLIRGTVRTAIGLLVDNGLFASHRDHQLEVVRLHALMDGFVLHLIVEPPALTEAMTRSILQLHLEDLAR